MPDELTIRLWWDERPRIEVGGEAHSMPSTAADAVMMWLADRINGRAMALKPAPDRAEPGVERETVMLAAMDNLRQRVAALEAQLASLARNR